MQVQTALGLACFGEGGRVGGFVLLEIIMPNHIILPKSIITYHNCTLKNSLSMAITWIIVEVVNLMGNSQHFSPRCPA